MPELPEVEITARLIGAAIAGAVVAEVRTPGLNALKTFDPPAGALAGMVARGAGRRGKHLTVSFDGARPLVLLVHLMSAGRLQLFDTRASARDRTARFLVAFEDGRELRLREFGTRQRAWVKLLDAASAGADEALAALGPEAWPEPPADLAGMLAAEGARPLYSVLRDQHVIAGIGRSWVDEILWTARLSPFARAADLSAGDGDALRAAIIERLGGAIELYERELALPLPDKLPLPLKVHRHDGEGCPRCETTIEAFHFEDYVLCYCPQCQTGGRVFKDRRLSRLLK